VARDLAGVIEALHAIGAVQFGEFRLKSGLVSPVYVDLRLLASYPAVLRDVAHHMAEVAGTLAFDRIAAIPLGGMPIGTALSLEMDRPMIYPRPEVKDHGRRRAVEGTYNPGETALVVDDLISTGGSKIEAIAPLLAEGLQVRDVLVVIDREQGGKEELARNGLTLHALASLTQVLEALASMGRVSQEQAVQVRRYLQGS
jgi:orotate phosphoribosyltransferase